MATQKLTTYYCAATRWSLDDLVAALAQRRPQPITPGKPEKREHEDIRHGVRALIASFVVPTGHVVWNWPDAHQWQRRAFLSDPTHQHVLHLRLNMAPGSTMWSCG